MRFWLSPVSWRYTIIFARILGFVAIVLATSAPAAPSTSRGSARGSSSAPTAVASPRGTRASYPDTVAEPEECSEAMSRLYDDLSAAAGTNNELKFRRAYARVQVGYRRLFPDGARFWEWVGVIQSVGTVEQTSSGMPVSGERCELSVPAAVGEVGAIGLPSD